MNDALQTKIKAAAKLPGCYLFKDAMGNIIYVGKAKVLANRVRSYFTTAAKRDERIQDLIRQIADVEFFVTLSETDALLQEYRLIKRHKPWFNSQLKRDTPHPFIRIDMASEYASISIADEVAEDGAEYFGSFFDIYDARETIGTLNSVWRTPLCMKHPLPDKPCLYHAIGRCCAPCVGAIPPADYRVAVEEIARLLRGERIPVMEFLDDEINAHIRGLEFEKAAAAQRKLAALEKLCRKGLKLFRLQGDQDAVVLVRAYRAAECVMFYIRNGAVANRVYISGSMDEREKREQVGQCLRPDPVTEPWLTKCVSEVFADKQVFLIGKDMDEETIGTWTLDLISGFLQFKGSTESRK